MISVSGSIKASAHMDQTVNLSINVVSVVGLGIVHIIAGKEEVIEIEMTEGTEIITTETVTEGKMMKGRKEEWQLNN